MGATTILFLVYILNLETPASTATTGPLELAALRADMGPERKE